MVIGVGDLSIYLLNFRTRSDTKESETLVKRNARGGDTSDFLLKNLFLYLTKGFSLFIAIFLLYEALAEIDYITKDNKADIRNAVSLEKLRIASEKIVGGIVLNIMLLSVMGVNTLMEAYEEFFSHFKFSSIIKSRTPPNDAILQIR